MRLDHGCALAVLTFAAACAGPSQGGEAAGAGATASAPPAAPAATTTATTTGGAGAFAPSRPPNPEYGSTGGYACPGGGVMDEL